MKKLSLSFFIVLSISFSGTFSAQARLQDSTIYSKNDIREYSDELGYFQKANRDLGDPRFMFSDESGKYEFGIGGNISISEFVGFSGALSDESLQFLSSNISVPTDPTPCYATKAACHINFKARAKIGQKKLLAFVQLHGYTRCDLFVKQAYISFGGLSLGMIPTFFTDLEVGPMTTGLGPDCPVDLKHTLLGYTWRFKEKWTAALALESSVLDLSHYDDSYLIKTNFQPTPDIVAHLKYKWEKGHFQIGALYRNLTYWAVDENTRYSAQGWNGHTPGYGFSVSANIKPTNNLKFSGQIVYGKGIAHYLPNLAKLNIDVGMSDEKHERFNTVKAIPVLDGLLAAQFNWSGNWSASLLTGFSRRFDEKGVLSFSDFRSSRYYMANVFYYLKDFAYGGIEYLYGNKSVDLPQNINPQGTTLDYSSGHAHRLIVSVVFVF